MMQGLKKSTAFSITKGGGLSRSLDACQSIAMLLKKKAALYIIIHKLLKKVYRRLHVTPGKRGMSTGEIVFSVY